MPFKPGQSGNISGRPKLDPQVKKLLESKCVWAIKGIVKLAEQSEDEAIRLKSLQYLVDRQLGKAPQAINLGDADGNKFNISVNITRTKEVNE